MFRFNFFDVFFNINLNLFVNVATSNECNQNYWTKITEFQRMKAWKLSIYAFSNYLHKLLRFELARQRKRAKHKEALTFSG